MGRPKGWMATQLGWEPMRSPGRPPAWCREHRQDFWNLVGPGLSSEDAGEGKSSEEALRALKQRLATVLFRILTADCTHLAVDPAGQPGTALISSVTGSHPCTGSSEKPLTGPTTTKPTHDAT